jgi:type II secretory pathway predicted ATPase ExeA
MYEASFGLNVPPFRLLPDPHFYLEDGQYATILAELLDGLEAAEPCLLLTGPAGSGKTAAAQRLLIRLDRSRWTVGTMLASTGGDPQDALRAAAQALRLAPADSQPGPALDAWLSTQAARGARVLLVVDEAQHLEDGALRQLAERIVPARDAPRLQLCLVGERAPVALAGAVRDGSMPPVAVHCRLRALDATETRDYVLHRLRCAGWTGRPAFDRAATDAIHRRSQGIPRRMHLLADRVLLQLSIDGADVATAAAVEAADEQRTVELHGLAPIKAEFRAPLPMYAPVPRSPSIEALLAGIVVPSRAGPGTGARPDRDAETPPRIQPQMPPLASAPDVPPASPSAVAPAGGSPPPPEGAVPPGTPPAHTENAGARGLPVGPATGAIVFAVAAAGIGIGWWLGGGNWPRPPGAADSAGLERMRPAVIAPGRQASGTVTGPAGELAAPADTATPAPRTATSTSPPTTQPTTTAVAAPSSASASGAGAKALPLEAREPPAAGAAAVDAPAPPRPAPAPRTVTAAPAPVASPAPSASPTGAPPPQAAAPTPRSTARAAPASPTPASCTGAAAVLGLCEPAAGVTPPATRTPMPSPLEPTAPPAADAVPAEDARPAADAVPAEGARTAADALPAADAMPAADAAPPGSPSATPLAAPLAAPCEPNRAALGLCER